MHMYAGFLEANLQFIFYSVKTKVIFHDLVSNKSLDVDLKSMIYYNGIANTGYEQWDKLFEIYRTATAASEKSKLLYGLAGSKEPWILRR